jgi:hypothetical protein
MPAIGALAGAATRAEALFAPQDEAAFEAAPKKVAHDDAVAGKVRHAGSRIATATVN